MPHLKRSLDVRPVDMEIGDDDMPGVALELTTEDIDNIVLDSNLSLATRRAQLMGRLQEMRARKVGDYLGDMELLSKHVECALALLASPSNRKSVLDQTSIYPKDRSDDGEP